MRPSIRVMLAALLLVSCQITTDPLTRERDALAQAEQRWTAANAKDYTMDVRVLGAWFRDEVRVEVHDGKVVSSVSIKTP